MPSRKHEEAALNLGKTLADRENRRPTIKWVRECAQRDFCGRTTNNMHIKGMDPGNGCGIFSPSQNTGPTHRNSGIMFYSPDR